MINIYLIRHAESVGNVNHHLVGGQSNHLPLTARGEEQAHKLGKRLASEGWRFDAWWSSTAVRTQETAHIVGKQLEEPPIRLQKTPDLLEVSQGEWEGRLRSECYHADTWARFDADPLNFKAPGGESFLEVQMRMRRWLDKVTENYSEKEEVKLAAFSHGLAIRCLLIQLLGASPAWARRMVTDNTSITGLQFDGDNWLIERINDSAHLAGMEKIAHY